jgi:quercetin dioxygenase-like cupin family protein
VESWNLLEIDARGGTRSPVVLSSEHGARAVLIALEPGQELGDHEVKERALVSVVQGSVRIESADGSANAGPGMLFGFAPEERHAVATDTGARILLFLSPWPGEGHYRAEERELR